MRECTRPPCPSTHRYRRQRNHFVPSSTPFLARSGSKPLQLFGLRKTPELSLALSQALSPLGAAGSVPATGGSDQPPVRTFCQIFGTQGRRECRALAAPIASFANEKSKRAQLPQVCRNSPAFPARWSCRLLRALPGVSGFLATVAAHIACAT